MRVRVRVRVPASMHTRMRGQLEFRSLPLPVKLNSAHHSGQVPLPTEPLETLVPETFPQPILDPSLPGREIPGLADRI